MKLMYKYRHIIGSVLTVTVTLMLMVTSVSADRLSVYDTEYDHHCKEPVSDCTPFVTVDGSLPSMGSSGFVHKSYEHNGKYQYYYFTTDGVYETLYLYGNFHAKSSFEQVYSFVGEVYLPNFIDTFQIDLVYDKGSKVVTENIVTRRPFEDSFLRTHSVDTSSSSALWSENSWYGSVSTEGRKEIEYYSLTIDEEVKVPKGSNNIRLALTFYNSSYKQVMFVLNECYIHHKYNGGVVDDIPKEYKWMKKYDDAFYEKYGYHSSILEFLDLFTKSKINEVFDTFDAITNIITYITTFTLDIGLMFLNPIIQKAVSDTTPVIERVLNNIFSNTEIFLTTLQPVIEDLHNRLTPEFEALADVFTDTFKDHFGTMSDSLNQLIDNTQDPTSSFFTSLIGNFRDLFKEFFEVPEDSEYVIEFEGQMDKLANKLPFIGQIETFFAALFNEENYNGEMDAVTQEIFVKKFTAQEIYECDTRKCAIYDGYLMCSKPEFHYHAIELPIKLDPNKEYYIKGNALETVACNVFRYKKLDGTLLYGNNTQGYTGKLQTLYALCRSDVHLISIEVYQVVTISEGFNFDIMGTDVNVLDFSWYLPYKAFVDTVIIAFVYLGFCWGLYKRLNTLV